MAEVMKTFASQLKVLVAVLNPANCYYHHKDGDDKPPTGMTAYDISSFDDKPIQALLKKCGPVGWLCIITDGVTTSKDANGNVIYDTVLSDDGTMRMEPKTRPPHVYIGRGGGSLDQMEDMFGHLG